MLFVVVRGQFVRLAGPSEGITEGLGLVGGGGQAAARSATKQGCKACLLEVLVRDKCFGQAALLHDDESQAVGKAPLLVRALAIEAESRRAEILTGRHDFHGGRFFFDACHEPNGSRARFPHLHGWNMHWPPASNGRDS